jgi:flagellar biosynthesis protein FlhF
MTQTLPQHVYPYFEKLIQQEVAEDLARRIVQDALLAMGDDVDPTQSFDAAGGRPQASQRIREAICRTIERLVRLDSGIALTAGTSRRVAFVGPAGAGKTTTLAKLAAQFKLRERRSVAIVSLDLHSITANEPLRRYAEIIGVPLHTPRSFADARSLIGRLKSFDLVLIDTYGVSARDKTRFVRLAALLRSLRPDEVHLVLPATLSTAAQRRALQTCAPLGVSRLALTRLDEVLGMGVILNVAQTLDIEVSYLADGQNVPQDIQSACRTPIAQILCQ